MTNRGPLGFRRPLTKQVVEINFNELTAKFRIEGPLGVKRPLLHPNPEITDEQVADCMQSSAANAFAEGMWEAWQKGKMPGVSADEIKNLDEWKEAYCRGTLEANQDEAVDDEDVFPPGSGRDSILGDEDEIQIPATMEG